MRRSAGSTSALLQKATSQLKGERVSKPEDELNAYISSLTQKTAQQKKSVNFEDLGDSISISSDIEDGPPVVTKVTPTASKFLKKKTPVKDDDDDDDEIAKPVSKFLKKPTASSTSPAPAASIQARYGGQTTKTSNSGGNLQRSSALSKASALTGKIQQRAATRRPLTVESDSDESYGGLQLARSSGEQVSESVTTESVKVGRDGGKFMKKKPVPDFAAPPQVSAEKQSKALTAGTKPGNNQEPEKETPKKASPYTLKSSLKYSTNVVLTSDEESMAEFMAALPSSSGDSFEKHRPQLKTGGNRKTPSPPPPKRGSSPAPGGGRPITPLGGRPPSPKTRPTGMRRTPSPSPRTPRGNNSPTTGIRKRSQSPKLYRSFSDDSNVAESIQSEIADDMDFGTTANIIMDLDELGPVEDLEPVSTHEPVRSTARKAEKENKKPRKSALKSTSEVSISERSQSGSRAGSPFKAKSKKAKENDSPFKASKKKRDKSPFKSTENSGSLFKASSESPFKTKTDSPFRASTKDSDSSSKGKGSPFKASSQVTSSAFKAKENDPPFKAKTSSSKPEASPFKASANESPFKASSKVTKSESKKEKKAKKNKASKEKKTTRSKDKKSADTDFFSSFGLQTVDDLFGRSVSMKESEYDSVMSEVEEVKSEISDNDEIMTEKVSVLGGRSSKYDHSVTDVVVTEIGSSRHSTASYSEDFDSMSERIGASSPSPKRSSLSEVKTRYSGEETVADYTETFEESDTTETETATQSRTPRSTDEDRTYSDKTYDSYSEDYSKSLVPTSHLDQTPRQREGMRTTEAQTTSDPGLYYQWNPYSSGMAFSGVPLGMGFVDPTPIAAHVVSPDALEAMTAYSPAMLALHDMLKSQLELTREFLQTQRQIYAQCVSNLQEERYHYTTLQDTKNYIKKHRKKRLTFKEALRLVDLEEARRH